MHLSQNECYHVYNQGNNHQPIFFNPDNYVFFIKKMREQILPVADIFAWCLMPNHFHFMIQANEKSIAERKSFGDKRMQEFAYRVGILLSSYSQAINKQNKTSGSLFRQKTKAKILAETKEGRSISYLENCFFYILQNPKAAGLVANPADWPYSCYPDYVGLRHGSLCNKELFFQQTGLNAAAIKGWCDWDLRDDLIKKLY